MTDSEKISKLKSRIPYSQKIFGNMTSYEIALKELLEDSKNIALEHLFPFEDISNKSLPSRLNNWQIRCCVELYQLADKSGLVNYSENGLTWSKLTDGLSIQLMESIIPHVGIPKKDE